MRRGEIRKTSTNRSTEIHSRRNILSAIISSTTTFSSVFLGNRILVPYPAHAAIDISGLRVEPRIPTSTDIFLGGTYFADLDDNNDNTSSSLSAATAAAAAEREEIIDRIGLMKYTIDLSGLGLGTAPKNGSRSITVRGRSSTISSRSDYSVELSGTIYLCPTKNNTNSSDGSSPVDMSGVTSPQQQQRQCITIDFSPIGGQKDVQGYWDEKENGIRFILDNKVWSKQ